MVDAVRVRNGLTSGQVVTMPQSADPFDGLGDFEVAPAWFEMMQLRDAERRWRERALAAEMSLRMVSIALSQPLKKCKKADLVNLLGVALDVVDANDWSLFSKGIME